MARFAELLATHWDRVYRFAFHLSGNAQDVDDLMQQVIEEALRAFGRFEPGSRFDRWLMRIMHRSFLDRVRHQRHHTTFSLNEVAGSLEAGLSADPEAALGASLDGAVLRAVRALPLAYRAPIILIDLQEMSYEDAAGILHCPIGTVRSRLHRGRLALREWLRPYVDAVKRGEA